MEPYSILSQAKLLRVSDHQTTSVFENCNPPSAPAKRTLILLWPQLGDFDTLEYAMVGIERERAKLDAANIQVRAVGIGDRPAAQKFCTYTGFPPEHLFIDPTASLHQKLNLYSGSSAKLPGFTPQQNGYLNLLLMCGGHRQPRYP